MYCGMIILLTEASCNAHFFTNYSFFSFVLCIILKRIDTFTWTVQTVWKPGLVLTLIKGSRFRFSPLVWICKWIQQRIRTGCFFFFCLSVLCLCYVMCLLCMRPLLNTGNQIYSNIIRNNILPRKILEWFPSEKTRKGRSRNWRMQEVTYIGEKAINNMERIDRKEWRSIIKLQGQKNLRTLILCTQITNKIIYVVMWMFSWNSE